MRAQAVHGKTANKGVKVLQANLKGTPRPSAVVFNKTTVLQQFFMVGLIIASSAFIHKAHRKQEAINDFYY